MKKLFIVIAFGIVGMAVNLNCGGTSSSGVTGRAQHSEPLRNLQAKTGEIFTIRLEANETTGYSWRGNERYDTTCLALIENSYQPETPSRPGSGGVQQYRFRALRAGTTEIRLTYKRSWETTAHDKTLVFTVRISNP